jgi:D-sedoheptulose 7-phosphate isomerase
MKEGKGMEKFIQEYIANLQFTLARLPVDGIQQVIETLIEAQWNQGTVFILGNGGSASTASHFACDLGKNTAIRGLPRMRVMALTDNVELITAWANDTEYANIFAEQLRPFVSSRDVVIGISGSGRSPNVLNAIKVARQAGATTIGLTGFEGGLLAGMVDIPIVVPSDSMERIEDVHLILEHIICSAMRDSQREQMSLILKLRPDLAKQLESEAPAQMPSVMELPERVPVEV